MVIQLSLCGGEEINRRLEGGNLRGRILLLSLASSTRDTNKITSFDLNSTFPPFSIWIRDLFALRTYIIVLLSENNSLLH